MTEFDCQTDMASARHVSSIEALCDEIGRPFDEVAQIYQAGLILLAAHAAVSDFLPIFASKKVRQCYWRRLQLIREMNDHIGIPV